MGTHTCRKAGNGGKTGAAGTLFFALAALHLTAGPTAADNNSLVGYPSTAIYARREVHFDFDTLGNSLRADAIILEGLTYGCGPERDGLFGRTEFGFDYILGAGGHNLKQSDWKRLLWNIKSQLYNSDARGVRLVAGLYAVGSRAVGAPNIGYLLASKQFKWGKVQVGVAHAFAREIFLTTPAGNSDRTYFQLAFQRRIYGRLFGAFNSYTGNSTQSRFSPGVTYFLNDTYKSAVALGVLHFNDSSLKPSRNLIYLGFDHTFGGK